MEGKSREPIFNNHLIDHRGGGISSLSTGGKRRARNLPRIDREHDQEAQRESESGSGQGLTINNLRGERKSINDQQLTGRGKDRRGSTGYQDGELVFSDRRLE